MKRCAFYAYALPLAIAWGTSILSACATVAVSRAPAPPALPAALEPGSRQTLDQILATRGDETWRCARISDDDAGSDDNQATAGALRWKQEGSAGTLVDPARRNIGNVLPGGYFVASDGSFVKAQLARQSQVDANTLTWALYDVVQHARAEPTGQDHFARITEIVRINTTGGLPPDPRCTHEGLRLLVPYSATYLLYRSSASSTLSRPALQKTVVPSSTGSRARAD